MMVLIAGKGYSWTFYAMEDGRAFFVDNDTSPAARLITAPMAEAILRECRWLFGREARVIYLDNDGFWYELKFDGNGRFIERAAYVGVVPTNQEWEEELS